MATKGGTKLASKVMSTRGGKLKSPPIMVYTNSPEERDMFVSVATADGRSLSNFMVIAAHDYIARRTKVATPKAS